MNKTYYLGKNDVSPQIDETDFEKDFFEYDPDKDANGEFGGRDGIRLANIAFSKARREKLPIEIWTAEHRMLYHSRQNKEKAN